MKIIQIIGPDGVGKSTICSSLVDAIESDSLAATTVWMRFNHYFSKLFNALARLVGKSYYESYPWGKLGYHDYKGIVGTVYIYFVFVDHVLFDFFIKRKVIKPGFDIILIDRYVFDTIVDLFVDTGNIRLPIKLFHKYLINEKRNTTVICLSCELTEVYKRRPDVIDDKVYLRKVYGYKLVRRLFNIKTVDTGLNTVESTVAELKVEVML